MLYPSEVGGIFIKFDKIWLLLTSAARPREAFIWGEGQPEGVGVVENGVEDEIGCAGNPVQLWGIDEGIDRAGLVPVKLGKRLVVGLLGGRLGGRIGSRLWLGDLGRGGLGLRGGGNGIAWVFNPGLVLLFAEPLSGGDICLDGRGHGLRRGWGKAAIWNQAFDGYDHRESLDLAGDGAPRRFVAKSGEFPEAVQYLVATNVELAQAVGFLVHQSFADGGAVLNHVGADAGLGFDVGGGFGVETNGFCGAAVSHGSGNDQVSKGHFLIGDGIGDPRHAGAGSIFGHR
jgi:hypothetical protein